MKKIKLKYIFNYPIFMYMFLFIGICACSNISEEKKCIIGQIYILRFVWHEENPFEKARYDTVIVLDKQNGWVKYRDYKSSDTISYQSNKVEYFLEDSELYR